MGGTPARARSATRNRRVSSPACHSGFPDEPSEVLTTSQRVSVTGTPIQARSRRIVVAGGIAHRIASSPSTSPFGRTTARRSTTRSTIRSLGMISAHLMMPEDAVVRAQARQPARASVRVPMPSNGISVSDAWPKSFVGFGHPCTLFGTPSLFSGRHTILLRLDTRVSAIQCPPVVGIPRVIQRGVRSGRSG